MPTTPATAANIAPRFAAAGLALAAALALAGCAALPPPLQGEFAELPPRAAGERDRGTPVRWGGRLVELQPSGARTCFELIAQPLAANARPDGSDASLGRFVACRAGDFPASRFRPNREVTVTGRIEGMATTPDGAQVPRVAADAVVLWPVRR